MSEQTKILLEQSKASAWPHLSIWMNRGFGKAGMIQFSIIISNKGTGPAIVEKAVITYDGKSVENWQTFFEAIGVPDSIPVTYSNRDIRGRVLASNEELTLIDWSNREG